MTVQDWVQIIGALGAAFALILTALGAIYVKVEQNHRLMDGRMSELLDLTHTAALAEGKLAGPDSTGGTPPSGTPHI